MDSLSGRGDPLGACGHALIGASSVAATSPLRCFVSCTATRAAESLAAVALIYTAEH